MKNIKDYLITENKLLRETSNHSENDIINAEKIMAKLLVGLTFELTYKVTKEKEDLGNTNLSFEFNPMDKEIYHVIGHMIESYLNPGAILSYTNKKTGKLDMDFEGNKLEIKTSHNDLKEGGKTPNHQKLYFSSQNQYEVLRDDPGALLLYIYYDLKGFKAVIEKVYLRATNMIEVTPKNKIDKNSKKGKKSNLIERKATDMCMTKLLPITKGNGEK